MYFRNIAHLYFYLPLHMSRHLCYGGAAAAYRYCFSSCKRWRAAFCSSSVVHCWWLRCRSNWKVSWRNCRQSSRKAHRVLTRSWCSCLCRRFRQSSLCFRSIHTLCALSAAFGQLIFSITLPFHRGLFESFLKYIYTFISFAFICSLWYSRLTTYQLLNCVIQMNNNSHKCTDTSNCNTLLGIIHYFCRCWWGVLFPLPFYLFLCLIWLLWVDYSEILGTSILLSITDQRRLC